MHTGWDYIIVGAGSAGGTLAARLSESGERRVLLIESGGRDWWPAIHIPGCLESLLGSRTWNWHYQGDPDPTLGGRRLTWAAGRGLGGSSSINGMVYGRGLPADYDRWVEAGNPGWGWADMLPWFQRSECWTGPPDPGRGTKGPITVRRFEATDPSCRAAMEALSAAGVPWVDDYNAGIVEGVGLTQATQRNGWRHSVARAYLRPARHRSNLGILTRTDALGLEFAGGHCIGVRIRRGRSVATLTAACRIILAAGAIGTPKLLMLSGIGPPEALEPHGIRVVHALAGVGSHLNDHVNIRLSAFVDRPTYNSQRHGLSAIRHGFRFLASRSGPATSPANHGQAFLCTDPGRASADVQIQFMPFGFGSTEEMRRDGITAVVSPCHPAARGEVRLRSADPLAPPRITMAMLDDPGDRATLLRGCRLARAALVEGPGRAVRGRLYAPADSVASDAAWLAYFRETAGLNWHPTSTCRMGPGPSDVVDGAFRVHGLTGLSIVDASVMPAITSGNTNGPVIALAERAAEIIGRRDA